MPVVSPRQGTLLRLLRLHGSVQVSAVAEQLGVAAMTIRRDLARLAEQGLVERTHGGAVLKAPEPPAGGAPPAPLRGSHALRFAMLTPGLGYYYGQVLQGAERAAAELGVQLVYVEHHYKPSREQELLERIAQLDPDGIILSTTVWPTEMDDAMVQQLHQLSMPVVLCERPEDRGVLADHDQVSTDHGYGVWLALRHLHALGHRRVTWVSRDTFDAQLRQRSAAEAAERLGIDLNDLTGHHPSFWFPHREACQQIVDLAMQHGSTAMLVHSDMEALGILPALRAAGLRLPTDMSLISSDDERAAAAATPLTAISPPKQEIGRRCVELLHRRVLLAGQAQPIEHVRLLPRLAVRESTAAVNAD